MNFTDELPRATMPSIPSLRGIFMTSPLTELPTLPLWHAALAILPSLALALAALTVNTARGAQQAWQTAGWAASLSLAAALGAILALALGSAGAVWFIRADWVGAVVMLLVTFIGWVIVRYSRPYLAGEHAEASYVRWLLFTLAAVTAVIVTNDLLLLAAAWTATSLALHRLLIFFGERRAAVVAAHKKFIAGRIADVCMFTAVGLLYVAYDTVQIDALLAAASAQPAVPGPVYAAVLLIAVAALLKCAQLPFHGWLIQVMEAPTPVSALLHAGIVNLGGFVLIRLAPLIAEVPAAQILLVAVGAFTAVVAALVMTTRVSIKVALAWSTCAQMGFMLLQCGLGMWEMALLHLIAHSLYKAHTFLSAGGAVRQTQIAQLAAPTTPTSIGSLMAGALIGLVMTAAAAWVWGVHVQAQPALWVLAGIVALALTPLVQVHALASGPRWMPAAVTSAFAVAFAYFGLHALFSGWVAPASAVAPVWLAIAVACMFLALFVVQAMVTANPRGVIAQALYPWFYGGLFLDERGSRALFRLMPPPAPASKEPSINLQPAAVEK
jgi:NAD(P)H-quinone oxidoreductase subunit 5